MEKQPKVAIIISTYNQEKILEKCLRSVYEKTDYKNYKIYFIDDSGKGNVGDKIRKRFNKINILTNKKNLGFSKSYNLGIKEALKRDNPDYFLLLNDDTKIVDRNWLKKMVEVGESDKKIGILGCQIIYPDGSLQWVVKKSKIKHFKQKGNFEKDNEIEKNWQVSDIIGCCFLIKKEVITKIGLLDEKFSPAYGEETDFCFRAKKLGYKFIYVGNTKIIHYGGTSTNKIESDFIWYIKKRNAIRLEWLNYNFLNIIKYSFIHFISLFKKNGLSFKKKYYLLIKAYKENIKNLKEIKIKRKERQ